MQSAHSSLLRVRWSASIAPALLRRIPSGFVRCKGCSQNAILTRCDTSQAHDTASASGTCGARTYSMLRPSNTASYHDATIFALSTGPGRAAIAVVRCSGPSCHRIYKSLCPTAPTPEPRQATLRKLHDPVDSSSILDIGALVLSFPAPSSVTGEDVLELHVHGGRATVLAVLSAISSISTPAHPIRPAEAGEFTQRAFYNGRMGIGQIEALGDTLAAETETQRALAARGAGGSRVLKDRYDSWIDQLLQARGELEALIDFSEDQHFDESPTQLAEGVAAKVRTLLRQVEASIHNAARGELLRSGIKIALLGAPNAGKSSLLNKIVGRDAAIVSSTAGTTRDVVETNVDINGFFCNLGDLAGIRASGKGEGDSVGDIELEGIRRAMIRAMEADVVIVVHQLQRLPDGRVVLAISSEVIQALRELDPSRQQIIHVINKVDLIQESSVSDGNLALMIRETLDQESNDSDFGTQLSDTLAKSALLVACNPALGEAKGIPALLDRLTEIFREMTDAVGIPGIAQPLSGYEESLGASERQASLLQRCRTCLEEFLNTVDSAREDESELDVVLVAENLRDAARYLGKMTGRGDASDVEDVLGVVFEKFCVGK